jgi:tRNA(His) 5'-end guanylyltransferase
MERIIWEITEREVSKRKSNERLNGLVNEEEAKVALKVMKMNKAIGPDVFYVCRIVENCWGSKHWMIERSF